MHPKQDFTDFGMHEVKKVCIPFATFSYLGCIVVVVAVPQSHFYLSLFDNYLLKEALSGGGGAEPSGHALDWGSWQIE